MSVFAAFLLCCPVQGASCERMFKDWQLYHTNKRNKLAREKVLKLMQINKDVQSHDRRGKSHLMPRRGASSKNGIGHRDGSRLDASQQPNRIVSPEERPRLNSTDVEGVIKEDESRRKKCWGGGTRF